MTTAELIEKLERAEAELAEAKAEIERLADNGCHLEMLLAAVKTPEEVWGEANQAHFAKWHALAGDDPLAHLEQVVINSADQAAFSVIRTAMEAYAAEKVAEALKAEPTEAMVEAGKECALEHTDDEIDVADIFRAMQAANQHHGGNDAD